MKGQADTGQIETSSFPDDSARLADLCQGMTDSVDCPIGQPPFVSHGIKSQDAPPPFSGTSPSTSSAMVNNAAHNKWSGFVIEDELSFVAKDSGPLSDICLPNPTKSSDDISYEVQQAYRIFHDFLLEKHKAITAPFWNPVDTQQEFSFANTVQQQGMCLKRISEKFVSRQYSSITDFVADFRLMLENCYRCHGVDHWISRQAQKVEMILEQKLTLLSRVLREKTRLSVTSKGRFGSEEEKVGPMGSSSRRRSVPRNLASVTMTGCESVMVQALRLEEQQRAKEERRQREQEKKEAEEASVKEVAEWEECLLSQASPWPVDTLWELPAIGHFLCLAQAALNLPEIVFYELERCLLMPRCSSFLAKVMTSLLCQPQRRASLHRRPALTYRRWEAELRQRVLGWYQAVGEAESQVACAQQLGLCDQFFQTLGDASPLEEQPFHLLPFTKRIWLLKGLCDNVYETQTEVQNAVLGQPIHECRESILGYDSCDNAYIHFPHFCGADLRIYCQSPCASPEVPLPTVFVRKVDGNGPLKTVLTSAVGVIGVNEEKSGYKTQDGPCSRESVKEEEEETVDSEEKYNRTNEVNGVGILLGDSNHHGDKTVLLSEHTDTSLSGSSWGSKGLSDSLENRLQPKQEASSSSSFAETKPPYLQLGNHCDSENPSSSPPPPPNFLASKLPDGSLKTEDTCLSLSLKLKREGHHRPCTRCSEEDADCSCSEAEPASPNSRHKRRKSNQKTHCQKSRKNKQADREQRRHKRQCKAVPVRIVQDRAAKSKHATNAVKNTTTTTTKRRTKTGKKSESRNSAAVMKEDETALPVQPTFKLVCSSLDELRELISKTEDEMDELESTKKKSGRLQFRREAVKELHITLIRLLNELSPWEPKLVRAFQKNRARLKKDYDDFKKHPEYDTFIREELVLEDEDFGPAKYLNSAIIRPMETEENDAEENPAEKAFDKAQLSDAGEVVGGMYAVRPGPFTRTAHQTPALGSTYHSWSTESDHSQYGKSPASTENSAFSTKIENVSCNEGSSTTLNQRLPETNLPPDSAPVPGVCRRNGPIQALIAKSVGNKVTLIRHNPTTVNTTHHHHMNQAAARKVFTLTQPDKLSTQTPQTHPATSGAPSTATCKTPASSSSLSTSPSQVVYKVPWGLGVLKKDGGSLHFKASPATDQNCGEKPTQHVVILPKVMLVQKSGGQQGCPSAKTFLTSVPVQSVAQVKKFEVEEQLVAPAAHSLNVHASPASNAKGNNNNKLQTPVLAFGANSNMPTTSSSISDPSRASNVKDNNNKPQTPVLTFGANSNVPTTSSSRFDSSASTESVDDAKQELRTVCIRDSKSILVTTRGGNTGVVKVQTSDINKHGASPASPIFSLCPQFKGLLVPTSTPPAKAPSLAKQVSTTTTISQLPTVKTSSPQNANAGSISVGLSCKTTPSTIAGNHCLIPVVSPQNVNVLPLPAIADASQQSQTRQSKGVTQQAPRKRPHPPEHSGQDQVPYQKMFLVAPSVSDVAKSATLSNVSPSVPPGARLMVLSHKSISSLPAMSFSKQTTLKLSTTTTTTTTNTTTTLSPQSTTATEPSTMYKADSVQLSPNRSGASGVFCKINVPTLPSPVVHTKISTDVSVSSSKMVSPELSAKTVPFCVSKAGALSLSRPVFVQNAANSSLSAIADRKVKAITALTGSPPLVVAPGHSGPSVVRPASLPHATCVPLPLSVPSLCQSMAKSPSALKPTIATRPPPTSVIKSQGLSVVPRFPCPVSTTRANSSVKQPSVLPLRAVTPLSPHRGAVAQAPASQATIGPLTVAAAAAAAGPKPVPATPSTTQQKIVINTSAPLAPGTQLLINNTRFVVPAQGLAAGSHVLLISSPQPPSEPRPNVNPTEAPGHVVRAPGGAPVSVPALPLFQERSSSSRMAMPRTAPPPKTAVCSRLPLPAPATAAVDTAPPLQSVPVVPVCSVRAPVPSVPCSAQISHLSGAAMSTGALNVASEPRSPSSVLTPGQKNPAATNTLPPVRLFTESVVRVSAAALPKTQESPYAVNIPTPLHTVSVSSTVSTTQLASRTVACVAKTVTVPLMNSSMCRVQAVPIATVQPIDGRHNNRPPVPATCPSPSSSNAVIMTPCRPAASSNTTLTTSIGLPVVVADSPQNKGPPFQIPAPSGLTGLSFSRLLVSPDGAILSSVRAPPLLPTIPLVSSSGAKGSSPSSLMGMEQQTPQKVANSLTLSQSQPTQPQGGTSR